MLWQLLLLAAALSAAYYRWSRRRLYRLAREIPSGLKEYPLVGHAYMFWGNGEDHMKAFQTFGRTSNRQGGLSSQWLGNRLFISMTDPECIELVTKTCLDKDEFLLKIMRTVTGNGSIFAPVDIWHPRRKIITPFFNRKNLMHAVKIFDEQSQVMVELMGAESGRGDFSIWRYMTSYTLDTIFETAGEFKTNFQRDPDNFYLSTIKEMTQMVASRMLQPWLHPDCIYKRLPVYRRFMNLKERAFKIIDEMIELKRKAVESVDYDTEKVNKNGLISMFEVVMQSTGGKGKAYSDIEMREEGIVMGIAGNDTSAVASSFTAVLLSRYPDVQDKVYQELLEVFGDSGRDVTAEDMPRLKYLEAVIKESLRLYPPVAVIVREIHKDTLLPFGTLVAGSTVFINIWATHRNPSYWGADAELFRPERFLEGPLRHPAQYIPFSYSVRNCIGSTYAMLSVKTGLAQVLRRYRLLPPANMAAADLRKPLRVQYEIMMKDVDNFILRIEKRHEMIKPV